MDAASKLYPDIEISTPLHLAVLCGTNDEIEALLDQGVSPATRTPDQGNTPLHLTVASENYLLDIGKKIFIDDRLFLLEENPFGAHGYSHCHIACLYGNLEIVRSFLDRGLDPNRHRVQRSFDKNPCDHAWHEDTCLHLATHAGHSDVVQLLLERGADPNACNAYRCTPLHNTMYDSQGSATKLLLKHGADVDARNYKEMTPLDVQYSSYDPKYKVVKALLEAGADVNLLLVKSFGVHNFFVEQLMVKHAIRLQEAGFDLSKDSIESILRLQEFDDMAEYRNDCRCELERMDQVRLDARTTLRDALRIHDPRRLQVLAVTEKFGRILAEEAALDQKMKKFRIYGYLARLKYRRGTRIVEAVPALQKLYAYMMAIGNNALPQECAEMVIYYLTYEEQWRVIQAASQ